MRRVFAITGIAMAAGAMVCTSPALAGLADVNAQVFYAQARAVMAKGMGAMFDKRTKPLMAQMKDAGKRASAENEAARTRGAPIYCVPDAARKKGMNAEQVLAMLERVPEQDRRKMTLAQAWRRALIREYPCR